MKKIIPYLLMFIIGFSVHNFAVSESFSKIAVVDVNSVLAQSVQFMALRKEQQNKNEELQKWIISARSDVNKQTTEEAKKKLTKKYDEELLKKRQAMQNDYTNKLNAIDKNISSVINMEAKKQGYDVVLTKNVVLYGGADITSQVAKQVK